MFPKIVGFTPKSSFLIGFSMIFTIHFGGFPYFWKHPSQPLPRWWFQMFFYVHPYLGKIPNLTNIFQMGGSTTIQLLFFSLFIMV